MERAEKPPTVLEEVLIGLLARLIPEDSEPRGHSHTNFCRSPTHQRVHEGFVQLFQSQCIHIQHPNSDGHIVVELELPSSLGPLGALGRGQGAKEGAESWGFDPKSLEPWTCPPTSPPRPGVAGALAERDGCARKAASGVGCAPQQRVEACQASPGGSWQLDATCKHCNLQD